MQTAWVCGIGLVSRNCETRGSQWFIRLLRVSSCQDLHCLRMEISPPLWAVTKWRSKRAWKSISMFSQNKSIFFWLCLFSDGESYVKVVVAPQWSLPEWSCSFQVVTQTTFQSNCCPPGCQSAVVRRVLIELEQWKTSWPGCICINIPVWISGESPHCPAVPQLECLGDTKLQNTHLTHVGIQFLRPHKQES